MKSNNQQVEYGATFEEHKSFMYPDETSTVHLTEKVSKNDQRIFYLAVIAILFSFSAFAFSGFNYKSVHQSSFVVVDVNQLLRQKATEIVKNNTDKKSDAHNEIQVAEQAKRIRGVIEAYAREHNLIVLMKGTVFGTDVREVTDDIRALL